MSVCMVDIRRPNQRIPDVEMPNHTWFCVMDIPGMEWHSNSDSWR